MDIQIINENITELENLDTTFDNVQELAYLYIIKDHFTKSDKIEQELSDILPAYQRYVEAKRRFQLNLTDSEPMIELLKLLCQEIADFIGILYSGTSTRKERHILEETLSKIHQKML